MLLRLACVMMSPLKNTNSPFQLLLCFTILFFSEKLYTWSKKADQVNSSLNCHLCNKTTFFQSQHTILIGLHMRDSISPIILLGSRYFENTFGSCQWKVEGIYEKMTEERAVTVFRDYPRIKTIHPTPAYGKTKQKRRQGMVVLPRYTLWL